MKYKMISAVVMTDIHTNDSQSYVNPLVSSVINRLSQYKNVCSSDDYYSAAIEVARIQEQYDVIIVFLRSQQLFNHPDLFANIKKPVVVVEHDAYQNSLEWHSNYQAWSRYFTANSVAALCVSGNQALNDLSGKIPGIVKRIAKGAPGRFFQGKMNKSVRYCIFGTVKLELYTERRDIYNAIQSHTIYDRVIRKWGLYRTSYLLSQIWRKIPDVSRIDFPYSEMQHILQYYSAAIICDRGLREPMMKHFEVAALGLVPFRDDECMEELGDHGYLDKESMVLYHSIGDLKEKMSFYAKNPSLLNKMQEKARNVTRDHTWEKRADELIQFIIKEII